jgi:hypothetical protein
VRAHPKSMSLRGGGGGVTLRARPPEWGGGGVALFGGDSDSKWSSSASDRARSNSFCEHAHREYGTRVTDPPQTKKSTRVANM